MAVFSRFRTIDTACSDYFHPYDPSCVNTTVNLTKDAALESFRIYCMAYLVGLIARKRVPSRRDLQRTFAGVLQSSLFLTTNAYGFSFFICFLRWLFGRYNFLTVAFVPSALASYVAINLERPSRRSLLALYVTNVASETLFKMAVARKLVKPVRFGEVLIFSLSIAQLLYFFRSDHISSDPIYGFLRFLVGPWEERGCERPLIVDVTPRQRRYSGKNLILKSYTQLYNWVQLRLSSFTSHSSCPHPDSCLSYALKDGGRLFVLGYAFQLCLKLLLQQRRIMRDPSLLTRTVLSPDTMRLAALFSSFNLIFKGVMCGLRRRLGRDDPRFAYPAGALAGVSFLLFRDNTIALYFMWKTFNILYNKAVSSGYVWDMPFSTEILYSVSTAVLFHAGVLEPDNLRPSYWRFLKAISGGRLEKLDRSYVEVFGFGTMKSLNNVLQREQKK